MQVCSRVQTLVLLLFALASAFAQSTHPDTATRASTPVPAAETLSYSVEWRLIHAGNAKLSWSRSNDGRSGWGTNLSLQSAGLVSRLYKVDDHYSSVLDDRFCAISSMLKTDEGSRHRETVVTFDQKRRKARYQEHDLTKDKAVVASHEIDIPGCVHDVIGGLYQLRSMQVEPGHSVIIPVSDGKKSVMARVEAQERETVKLDSGTFKTVRYEAFLFDNVLYRRRGRLFVWLTDDGRKVPVQIRIRLPFYIGTVTLQLEKEGKA
jgi:hypothetical protein